MTDNYCFTVEALDEAFSWRLTYGDLQYRACVLRQKLVVYAEHSHAEAISFGSQWDGAAWANFLEATCGNFMDTLTLTLVAEPWLHQLQEFLAVYLHCRSLGPTFPLGVEPSQYLTTLWITSLRDNAELWAPAQEA